MSIRPSNRRLHCVSKNGHPFYRAMHFSAKRGIAIIGVDPARVQGSGPSQKLYCEGP